MKRSQQQNEGRAKSGPAQRVPLFGNYVEKLYNAVQHESWKEMPVGPVGAHILATDKRYGTAIDGLLGGMYKSYVVFHSEDASKMHQLIRKTQSRGVNVLKMKKEGRFTTLP